VHDGGRLAPSVRHRLTLAQFELPADLELGALMISAGFPAASMRSGGGLFRVAPSRRDIDAGGAVSVTHVGQALLLTLAASAFCDRQLDRRSTTSCSD
jgi:hypothetical protein